MKTNHFVASLLSIILLTFSGYTFSQGSWIQKANVGGTATRFAGVGFSIGTKGYIGSGVTLLSNDFWEWDQATNVWTQKANFTGGYRLAPVGFSIGNKGYIATGSDGGSVYYNDFWEWDQATNTWSQKAAFGGVAREFAFGFSIGSMGYIGAGEDASQAFYDFWEWNQATNTWSQKALLGGSPLLAAVGFSIGTYGYVGPGLGGNDLWEWDQTTNVWTQKANFAGTPRTGAAGFSIGSKGYIGTGEDTNGNRNDFWEWDQATNTWTQLTDFGGAPRNLAVGFSIGNKGYIGTGRDNSPAYILGDFWEFDPSGNSVNEIDLSDKISVFPNPSNGKFILHSEKTDGSVLIYNAEGEKVFEKTNDGRRVSAIDISTLANGIYFLKIRTNEGAGVKKLIVQR